MSKPREWWISSVPSEDCQEAMICCDGPYAEGYENVHVIEKSAYDELAAANAELLQTVKVILYNCARSPDTDTATIYNKHLQIVIEALAKHGGGK